MNPIISLDRSFIVACDVLFQDLPELLKNTRDLPYLGAYKVPGRSGRVGWERWIEEIRKYSNKPVLYDHQKLGTDLPHTAHAFIKEVKQAGFDAAFVYPLAGPATQRELIKVAKEEGLELIVGGLMTHQGFLRSEQGYLADEAVIEIYNLAAELGVTNFGVPSTRPELVRTIKEELVSKDYTFYFIGVGKQGGLLPQEVSGNRWHVIVGRGIYESNNQRQSAIEYNLKIEKS